MTVTEVRVRRATSPHPSYPFRTQQQLCPPPLLPLARPRHWFFSVFRSQIIPAGWLNRIARDPTHHTRAPAGQAAVAEASKLD